MAKETDKKEIYLIKENEEKETRRKEEEKIQSEPAEQKMNDDDDEDSILHKLLNSRKFWGLVALFATYKMFTSK
jgi:hypothetical protein